MHETHGRCGDGRQGLEKQVAARQADGDLGHVPMMLCPVLSFARSGMPTERMTMLIIRASRASVSVR